MRLAELRIKICTLAFEGGCIHRHEKRYMRRVLVKEVRNAQTGLMEQRFRIVRNSPVRLSLRDHRKEVVRPEARAAQLALAFLRGRPYAELEAKCHPVSIGEFHAHWKRVHKNVVEFGDPGIKPETLELWRKGLVNSVAEPKAA